MPSSKGSHASLDYVAPTHTGKDPLPSPMIGIGEYCSPASPLCAQAFTLGHPG